MIRPSRKLKNGERISLVDKHGDASSHEVVVGEASTDGIRTVVFAARPEIVLSECGRMPIPPYLGREAGPSDEVRYQTIFAKEPGAVAAPTASLHLTHDLLIDWLGRQCGHGYVACWSHSAICVQRT